eukprot:TRINITY_DN568_c0_g1_i2.p1 TRINITY_DN568_c0_g1~~TRINITY_DN568_c0_g1_i2.p1  ORF type:complete len:4478 (+),score=1217.70 TRINITY_DN568_c0_g1_i2:54-13487(+)
MASSTFDARHQWVFRKVGEQFNVPATIVEQAAISSYAAPVMNRFFTDPKCQKLLCVLQGLDAAAPQALSFTDSPDVDVRGACVYFVRTSDRSISGSSIEHDVNVGQLDGWKDGPDTLLQSMNRFLQQITLPALNTQKAWAEFVDGVRKSVDSLVDAASCLRDNATLKAPAALKTAKIENKPTSYMRAASTPDIVAGCEVGLEEWMVQITAVLREPLNRREDDLAGPTTELDIWKARMAKFNAITEQIKARECKTVIGVLQAAKSDKLNAWRELDMRLTDAANEAKDNIKYLYTLDKFVEPLYKCEPPQLIEAIPGIVNAIRMMHSIARYYNTPERMMGLFVKVTNQLVICCRRYILRGGSLWKQDPNLLRQKLCVCVDLNYAYQNTYRETKHQTGSNRQQTAFSDGVIFDKIDMLAKRLRKLIDLFSTIDQFQTIARANIEGMQVIVDKFKFVLERFSSRTYDLLDTANVKFEADYVEFNSHILDLEEKLQKFMNQQIDSVKDTNRSLELLKRFNHLFQRENLKPDIESKYKMIFGRYFNELENVRKIYETNKENPPVARNYPPVAGVIAWSRQLMRRIEAPMAKFQEQTLLMKSLEARRVVKLFNKIAAALVQYESIWHEGWVKAVMTAKAGLHATLLVRDPEGSDKLYVNFDHEILQVMRETREMQRLGLAVPEVARLLCEQEDRFKKYRDGLQQMLKEVNTATTTIPVMFKRLMRPRVQELMGSVERALTELTWSSMNIEPYLAYVRESTMVLQELATKVADAVQYRIMRPLETIGNDPILFLPAGNTLTAQDLVQRADVATRSVCTNIDTKSMAVEAAVQDVLALVCQGFSPLQQKRWEGETMMIVRHYFKETYQKVLQCIKSSLGGLRHRISQHLHSNALIRSVLSTPLFTVDVVLHVNNVVMRPTLEEIQKAINAAGITILGGARMVLCWNQDRSTAAFANLKTCFVDIARSKEIIKIVLMMAGTFTSLTRQVDNFLNQFMRFDHLWKKNQNAEIEAFLATEATLEDYERVLQYYTDVDEDISSFPDTQTIGPLQFQLQHLKQVMCADAAAWKIAYSVHLNKRATVGLDKLLAFIEETGAKLSRKTSEDLDNVRKAMQALQKLREMESVIDMELRPIDDAYSLLVMFDVPVDKAVSDGLEHVRYQWARLKATAGIKQAELVQHQIRFRTELGRMVTQFRVDVKAFKEQYDDNGPMVPGLLPRVASERVLYFSRSLEDLTRKLETINAGEGMFGFAVSEFPHLQRIGEMLRLLTKLYGLYNDVSKEVAAFGEILWRNVDFEYMTTRVSEFRVLFRQLPVKAMRDWTAYKELRKIIEDCAEMLPLLQALHGPTMQARHWQTMIELMKYPLRLDMDTLTLKELTAAPLLQHQEEIEDIAQAAVKEVEIESSLNKIVAEWADEELIIVNFKHRGPLMLKGAAIQDLTASLEDSLMILAALLGNRYNAPFKEQIKAWVQKLTTCSERLEHLMSVQSLWAYMEAVFSGGDIARQMPAEAKKFANIDKSWVRVMTTVGEKRNVVQCCVYDETLKNLLPILTEQLDQCQKSLSSYLDTKRSLFPRFYFVSDPVLLEILGQGSDPTAVRPHLKSVFDNIADIRFDRVAKPPKVIGMTSSENEYVELSEPFTVDGNIESWLNRLLDVMRKTIKDSVRNAAIQCAVQPLQDFIAAFPAQVALLGLQFMWTTEAEDALGRAKTEKSAMPSTNKRIAGILRELVAMTTKDLTTVERTKIETLVTIQVHQRDEFDHLHKQRIKSASDFEWQKQTRFYWKPERDECIVMITDVEFVYNYEYLGVSERLVITPLTDRCYITLAQAISMFNGGAPAGPAGTGKTETVKDMGKALGKYVVVFNCSDQMDYRGLGKIFKGIAQSGCWGDFDEFNRIRLEVLSVAAQQIQSVFNALKERRDKFTFTDGTSVSLSANCGIFITMNPGYAGRQELPENLKMCFRSVAMMVPDRQIIIRVKLASCGFQDNILLSKKFYVLYQLCQEQLSNQRHYDFGLRNVLSVLRTCGFEKRSHPEQHEEMILMRVLRDMNVSKLVDEDEPLFLQLLEDLFPGVRVGRPAYDSLRAAISAQCKKDGLVEWAPWVAKLLQLYETSLVRHGVMILGPSGAGKTTCINTLLEAMGRVKEVRMNPKAVTATQMFGRLDVATNEWTDGIFARLWRDACKTTNKRGVWIVLDGPIDTLWIENLNTVLDDNKTLTLANSDRIPMPASLKLIFEVGSLDNASPATVSRAGMIYMNNGCLGWSPILDGWLNNRKRERDILHPIFHALWEPLSSFVHDNAEQKMTVNNSHELQMCLTYLDGLLPSESAAATLGPQYIERLAIFAIIWSVGGVLDSDGRAKLHFWLSQHGTKFSLPEVLSSETAFDYVVNASTGNWEAWRTRIPDWSYPSNFTPEFSTVLVPTVDSVRTEFLVDVVAKQNKHVLLIGESGSAKTVTVQSFLSKQSELLAKTLNFSCATSPLLLQRSIEGVVDKRIGTTWGPPGGKRMIIFVDDMNMPAINEWGDQVTNELTRQLMERHGFYNLDKPGEWYRMEDLQFVGAMSHPGGGRNDIPSRLKRWFTVVNCALPSNASVDKIYGSILTGHFCAARGFNPIVVAAAAKAGALMRTLWQSVKAKLLPTPTKFHYIFSLRDLSRIVQGMIRVIPETTKSAIDIWKLWAHESFRVLADRFTTSEDMQFFQNSLRILLEGTPAFKDDVPEITQQEWYVTFLREASETDSGEVLAAPEIYERVPSLQTVRDRVLWFQQEHNSSTRGVKLDLVLFDEALKNLFKIVRILTTAGGHALLLGVGGSGKQTLTRLAAYIIGSYTFQISVTKSYNTLSLLDDMKTMFKAAGLQNKHVTFLFTENELKEESFLEFINNLLTVGEIPNLFTKEEWEGITSELRPKFKRLKRGEPDTYENLVKHFMRQARTNLHLVLSFSPVGDKLRSRALKFPGIVAGCTTVFFSPWPREALISVAKASLANFDIANNATVKAQLIQFMAAAHGCVQGASDDFFRKLRRPVYVTPKSFLMFLMAFKEIYSTKRAEINLLRTGVTQGLENLSTASREIARMRIELIEKEKALAVAQQHAREYLVDITAQTTEAEKVKAAVLEVKEKLQEERERISLQKADAEQDLAAAEPALQRAAEALNSITVGDIAALKKMAKPPNLIKRILDGVLILNFQDVVKVSEDPEVPRTDKALNLAQRKLLLPSWGQSVRMMTNTSFLSDLLNFPKDSVTDETCELLAPYLEMMDFTTEAARKVSGNIAGLCTWIKAMVEYHEVAIVVEPKRQAVWEAENRLHRAETELHKAIEELEVKEARLRDMQAKYDEAMATKQRLQDDADLTRRRMEAAEALITGLSDKKSTWTAQKESFDDIINRLVGDVAVSASFLTYCGPFNQEFRTLLLQVSWADILKQRSIPRTEEFDVIKFLCDETTVGEWVQQELPLDDLSVQNAIIVKKSARYPLIIDPQGQGKNWIVNNEQERGLKVTRLTDKTFRRVLEQQLLNGQPLLIEDVTEELDPVLDPILEKRFVKKPSGWVLILPDKDVDYTPGFQLYITTKLSNPRFSPEVSASASVINFTVTMKGLEDQLLSRIIMREKEQLELQKRRLMKDVTASKRKIQELEANLLSRLMSTGDKLLDDTELIAVLQNTKTTMYEVQEALASSVETESKINGAREEYRPVASRGSILYFLIAEMSLVNPMYMTSLAQFMRLFEASAVNSAPSPVAAKRISNIIEYLTYSVYSYVGRGLHENHKQMFTLQLCLKIDLQRNHISHQEYNCLIRGGAAKELNQRMRDFAWIPDAAWLNLLELSQLGSFAAIFDQLSRNEIGWRKWYEKEAPEESELPDNYDSRLDSFRRLLLIRAFCEDRTTLAASAYIMETLGARYVEPLPLDWEGLYHETDERTPVVCLLSPGADPATTIEQLAKKMKQECKSVSMGQGQDVHARRLIQQHMHSGGWVVLQNAHLGLAFMDELAHVIQSTEQISPEFRVWITTAVDPQFPIDLLQMSTKVSNEPPQGVKAGLLRSYKWVTQDLLEAVDRKEWRAMLFAVCFLHTTLLERRKYGPLGWCIPYEFNHSDLVASVTFLHQHLYQLDTKKDHISWPTIRYMLCDVQYGGRVTDDYDRRLLSSYGNFWFDNTLLMQDFSFFPGNPAYCVPPSNNVNGILSHIDTLPRIDVPDIFGLHRNADLTYRRTQALEILSAIGSVQPKEGAVMGSETREDVVLKLVDEYSAKLPNEISAKVIARKAPTLRGGPMAPLAIFLRQEIDRMNRLLLLVRRLLADLKLAIAGTIVMSDALQALLNDLFDAKVPMEWQRVSWPASKLGTWFAEVIRRSEQLYQWLMTDRPKVFRLSSFFNAQGFLTAVKQEVKRQHVGWPLDAMTLHTQVLQFDEEEVPAVPDDGGVLVHGLWLEGASWDRRAGKMRDQPPKVLYVEMPVIFVTALHGTATPDPRAYHCPVYKTPARTNVSFIFHVYLRTDDQPEKWIRRGAAMLGSTT